MYFLVCLNNPLWFPTDVGRSLVDRECGYDADNIDLIKLSLDEQVSACVKIDYLFTYIYLYIHLD
jgi:hypothetical protein